MTNEESSNTGDGAGRKSGSIPFSLRRRARLLYRARRQRLMVVPIQALQKRFGDRVEVDDETHLWARAVFPEMTVEVAFAGKYRMFGALIDTQWVASTGTIGEDRSILEYRFDKRRFVVKSGEDDSLAKKLSTKKTDTVAQRCELKVLRVLDDGQQRRVEIIPLPGTITAVYFPPMPPFSVPIKASEALDHIDLATYLVRL